MAKKPDVKESTEFDDFVGKKSESPLDIIALFGEQASETDDKEWKKHWKGMPAFEQEDKPTYKTVYFHFRNKKDYEEFCEKYKRLMDEEQTITQKTKSVWYPHLDRDANTLLRWVEVEE